MLMLLTLISLFIFEFVSVSCENITHIKRLKADLLDGYDKKLRPLVNQSSAVQVNVTFDINYISELDEVKSKLSMSMFLYVFWFDDFIRWDPNNYGGIKEMVFHIDDVWYPPLIIGNDYNALGEIINDWGNVRYSYNGRAAMSPGNIFHLICSVSALYFPYDNQTCFIGLAAWSYPSSEININTPRGTVLMTYYVENGEWEITQTATSSSSPTDPMSFGFCELHFKRKPMFMFVNTVLPIIFMSALALLVFVLPVESGERMSFIITVLLAVAVFLTIVSDNLPKTSSPMPLICIYLVLSLTITSLICLVTVLNLKIYFLDNTKKPVPRWCQAIVRKFTCRGVPKENETDQMYTLPINGETDEFKARQKVDNKVKDDDEDISWKELSSLIDKISLIMFALLIAVVTAVFIGMLVYQTPMN